MSSSRDAGPGLSDSSALFGSFSRFQLLDDSPKKREEKPNGQEEKQRIVPAEGTHAAGSEPRRRKKRSKSTRLALLDADNQDIGNDTEALADVSHCEPQLKRHFLVISTPMLRQRPFHVLTLLQLSLSLRPRLERSL